MQSRSFRPILIGDIFANFGSWIDFLAILNLSAYQFKASSYDMAWLSCALLIPGIAFARKVGRICDRHDAKRILYAAVFLRIIGTLVILFANRYVEFLFFVAAHSAASAFIVPAINTLTARTSPSDLLAKRFSLLSVTNNSCKILAPTIGAAASQYFGEHSVLVVSAVLTGLGGICFLFATKAGVKDDADPAENEKETGKQSASNQASPIPLLVIVGIYAFLGMAVNNQMPLILKDLGFTKHVIGLLVSSAGAGGTIGALYLVKRSNGASKSGRFQDMIFPPLVSSVLFILIGLILRDHSSWNTIALCACFFVSGLAGASFAVTSNVYMSRTFTRNLGEISSVRQGVQSTVQLVAPVVGAFLLGRFSSPMVFIMDGCLVFLLLSGSFFYSTRYFGASALRKPAG
ncbi:MFS transporter [Paraburkholderia megapolitana]|uniref:Predicted arabinose efflux permease, MFS family n=1 Tax=Paraburkholderia megapolitana TaxID=420953 RepID=A0A1I3WA19_9BURK|nr:MFS transporter [Paraburkholderia megapolitana]SFK04365.1 Predicted arabinose efflux permease, MFS family [Paraburkholderia megapolitana]